VFWDRRAPGLPGFFLFSICPATGVLLEFVIVIGIISYIHPEKPFGFIRAEDGTSVFFHRNQVTDFAFGPELRGQHCAFDVERTEKGLAARDVRPR